jgi:hypothetical protein
MAKPLLRWTVGPCTSQGLEILAESIHRTTKALGIDKWDWVVCYNGLNKDEVAFLATAAGNLPINFVSQDWALCPINDHCQTPRRRDGSFEWNGTRCGGTLWKVCPARMRMESHEIVMDNDVVILKKFPQIDEWLAQTEKALVLEEYIRFYGRYDSLFPPHGPFLNSGFMGFPPGYNFGTAIAEVWEKHARYTNLSQADEQGLLTYTLNQLPNYRITPTQMVEVLHRDFRTELTGRENAIHFVQSNRIPNHHQWNKYKELMAHARIM